MDWCDFSCEHYLDVLMRVITINDHTRSIWQVKRRFMHINEAERKETPMVTLVNVDRVRINRKPRDCALIIPFEQRDIVMCGIDIDWLKPCEGEDVVIYSFRRQGYYGGVVAGIDGTKSLIAIGKQKVEVDTKFVYVDLAIKGAE